MTASPVTVGPGTTLAETATLMGTHQVGSVLVVEDDRLLGIFTERDALRALASDFDAETHPVSEAMTPNPVTATPSTDAREALRLMLDRGFRHLPVVEDGRIRGVVSIRDLSRTL